MIEALLTLAVSDQGKLSTEFTDLATWAEDAIDAAAPQIERLDLHVDTRLDPAETSGDPQLLERMISNLVDNAVRHNEPEPFRRMEARTGVREGTGLGLSIARSVATAHRATVTARSQPAGGLGISVVIPRCIAAEPRPAAGPQP
jgi:signal transduction histidine kinase